MIKVGKIFALKDKNCLPFKAGWRNNNQINEDEL